MFFPSQTRTLDWAAPAGPRALFAGIDVPGCEPAHLTVVAIVRQVDLGSDAHNFASAFWGIKDMRCLMFFSY